MLIDLIELAWPSKAINMLFDYLKYWSSWNDIVDKFFADNINNNKIGEGKDTDSGKTSIKDHDTIEF